MKELLTRADKRFLNSVGRNLTSNGYQPPYSVKTEGLAERTNFLLRTFRSIRDNSEQKRIDDLAWAERVLEAVIEDKIMRQGDIDIFVTDELTRNRTSINFAAIREIFGRATFEDTKTQHREVAILEKADPKVIYPRMVDKANLIVSKNRKQAS